VCDRECSGAVCGRTEHQTETAVVLAGTRGKRMEKKSDVYRMRGGRQASWGEKVKNQILESSKQGNERYSFYRDKRGVDVVLHTSRKIKEKKDMRKGGFDKCRLLSTR